MREVDDVREAEVLETIEPMEVDLAKTKSENRKGQATVEGPTEHMRSTMAVGDVKGEKRQAVGLGIPPMKPSVGAVPTEPQAASVVENPHRPQGVRDSVGEGRSRDAVGVSRTVKTPPAIVHADAPQRPPSVTAPSDANRPQPVRLSPLPGGAPALGFTAFSQQPQAREANHTRPQPAEHTAAKKTPQHVRDGPSPIRPRVVGSTSPSGRPYHAAGDTAPGNSAQATGAALPLVKPHPVMAAFPKERPTSGATHSNRPQAVATVPPPQRPQTTTPAPSVTPPSANDGPRTKKHQGDGEKRSIQASRIPSTPTIHRGALGNVDGKRPTASLKVSQPMAIASDSVHRDSMDAGAADVIESIVTVDDVEEEGVEEWEGPRRVELVSRRAAARAQNDSTRTASGNTGEDELSAGSQQDTEPLSSVSPHTSMAGTCPLTFRYLLKTLKLATAVMDSRVLWESAYMTHCE
jgi:hypothetical protein